MKAYTDLEQSKKLAEFLPLESADMCYIQDLLAGGKYGDYKPYIGNLIPAYGQDKIRCWSLAALLGVLPYLSLHKTFSGWRCDSYNKEGTSCILGVPADNPVDACYEMILKLHKLKML